MTTAVQNRLLFFIIFLLASIEIPALSGGSLSPEQAAYDVKYYELDLRFDIDNRTINGFLLCRAEIINPLDTFVLDLDDVLIVDSVLVKIGDDDYVKAEIVHSSGKLIITLPGTASIGNEVTAKVFYGGEPRTGEHPPWDAGFVWETRSNGEPWIGVSCETEGADIWWPCKDHPSDEPDSMSLSFTVPQPLQCVSNGRFVNSVDNGDNTRTFNWFISAPINNYNVTFYIAEYVLIEDTYQSVSGENIPFKFWVLPEAETEALDHMDIFKTEFDFLELVCGPFPFGEEKHGWAHAPYWGMEHQSIIAYGSDFSLSSWGFDYIHYHELAHEWWGNLITAKDWSDVWIHEGLGTYMEALYVEYISGPDKYREFMEGKFPLDNHIYPLAPREPLTADDAFHNLNSYNRGCAVMHTLRYYLGDGDFFELLKRWAYPDPNDLDNTNGRQCRILSTDDMKDQAEEVTGIDLDPFFEAFFRQAGFPVLNVFRGTNEVTFEWMTENSVILDLDIPIRINGIEQTVDMTNGSASMAISAGDVLDIDPEKRIIMGDPVISSNEDHPEIITDFRLNQNYPNPFNPETNISFQLAEANYTVLKVYNILGTEAATLVDEYKSAGAHQVRFSGKNLSSGIYFYTLTSGKYKQTKKMLLVK